MWLAETGNEYLRGNVFAAAFPIQQFFLQNMVKFYILYLFIWGFNIKS